MKEKFQILISLGFNGLGESINQSTVKCHQINQVKLTVGLMNYS